MYLVLLSAAHLARQNLIYPPSPPLPPQLYKEAARIITESKEFEEYDEAHVGHVHMPPKTPFMIESHKNSKAYIKKTQTKEDAHQSVMNAKAAATKLYQDADAAEDKVRFLAINLEKTGNSMSFEARIASRKKMLTLKDDADFLREQATVATEKADQMAKDAIDIIYADTVQPLDFEAMEGIVEPRIEAWVLCRPVNSGGLGKVFYGNFTGGEKPPLKDWIAVDKEGEEKPNLTLKPPSERIMKERLLGLKEKEKARKAGENRQELTRIMSPARKWRFNPPSPPFLPPLLPHSPRQRRPLQL